MAIQAFGLSEILSIVHLKAVQCTIKGGASIYQPTGDSNLVLSGGLNFADDVMQDRKYLLTASSWIASAIFIPLRWEGDRGRRPGKTGSSCRSEVTHNMEVR